MTQSHAVRKFDQEHLTTWQDAEQTIQTGRGDCFRTCIAMLASEYDPDLRLADVPHFFQSLSPDSETLRREWQSVHDFLRARGLKLVDYDLIAAQWASGRNPIARLHELMTQGRFFALGGKSPRHQAVTHAVVMHGPEMYHDPHPTHSGIWSLNTLYVLEKMDSMDPMEMDE